MKKRYTGLTIALICLSFMILSACGNNQIKSNSLQNRTSKIQNTPGKMDHPLTQEQQVTGKIKGAAEKVVGVNKATVAIHGVNVLVGVEANNAVKGKRLIEREVYFAVKKVEPNYNIYVTADTQLNQRIKVTHPPVQGMGVKNIGSDVNGIIQDIGKKIVIPSR